MFQTHEKSNCKLCVQFAEPKHKTIEETKNSLLLSGYRRLLKLGMSLAKCNTK